MTKENLVIVQPFAGNSRRLKGLIEFLKKYFTVYFLDLPGFSKDIPPLNKITLDNFSKYVSQKIKALNLKEYWAGGISLGFEVINQAKLDQRCKGIFAVEPYINADSLNPKLKRQLRFLSVLVNLVCLFRLFSFIWYSKFFKNMLLKFGNSKEDVQKIITETDAKTFFETLRIIFSNKKHMTFHHQPCVLLLNKHDEIIDYHYIMRVFKNNPEKELILNNLDIPHIPESLDVEYFEQMFPVEDIQKIKNFIAIVNRSSADERT